LVVLRLRRGELEWDGLIAVRYAAIEISDPDRLARRAS
jgi:hypothetical protein